ncbi:hypothetical protein RFI_06990 [Reticulomyxa filosa]|uniref:Uncharacterized protein n=1 Tax=Reticulomyxa filosa TaxID=46433 RepID=X6NUZ4_RETFI|nr:hypothetical protein RFI_06990 [Reticulomyxa filosa]|eukprot:ETO30130.1 hypothetical protein RFI_06990 [Reticulomyxa filosa]
MPKQRLEESQIEEIHEILRLLKHMSTKDLLSSADVQTLSGESVLMGLNYLIPHLNDTLLEYPQLCDDFFDVLAIALSVFTNRFAIMSRQYQTVLTESIPFALRHCDPKIVQYALEIITCMAIYHFSHRMSMIVFLCVYIVHILCNFFFFFPFVNDNYRQSNKI